MSGRRRQHRISDAAGRRRSGAKTSRWCVQAGAVDHTVCVAAVCAGALANAAAPISTRAVPFCCVCVRRPCGPSDMVRVRVMVVRDQLGGAWVRPAVTAPRARAVRAFQQVAGARPQRVSRPSRHARLMYASVTDCLLRPMPRPCFAEPVANAVWAVGLSAAVSGPSQPRAWHKVCVCYGHCFDSHRWALDACCALAHSLFAVCRRT